MHPNSPGGAEEPEDSLFEPGQAPESSFRRLTRRDFLKTAVVAGAAVGIAGFAYWAGSDVSAPVPTAGQSPGPSPTLQPRPSLPPGSKAFLSRPDLWGPVIVVTASAADLGAGLLFLTPRSGPGPIIVDNAGSPVWIRPVPGKQTLNLRMGSYRGAPVLTWWEGTITRGTGQGEYVILDASYREVARVQAQNGLRGDLHEFILSPQNTALFGAYADRPVPPAFAGTLPTPPPSPSPTLADSNLPALYESIIQEVDVETGKLLFEWHSADHIGLDETYAIPSNDQSFDYFHLNSIDVEPDGNLLISARHTCALYKIDRTTGEVIWRLGGKKSDFVMGPGTEFLWQHDARRHADGTITVFDDGSNGKNPPSEPQSRGLRLAVDETAMTVARVREYTHEPSILAKSQGSVQTLENGDVLVGWGDQPNFTEFRVDGTVAFDARLPDGASSYRALRFEWPGRGDGAPAVAGVAVDGGSSAVYASWNGANDVASWKVLAGDTATALTVVASAKRTGFETAIPVSGRPAYVAVRALDVAGQTLGESQAVALETVPSPTAP